MLLVRVKTDAKRSELLRAAIEVFLSQGYERTLMSHVSDRATCSKGTLYSYFASKEELFCEAVLEATAQETQSVFTASDSQNYTPEALLTSFGESYLSTVYAPRFQALRRLVFSVTPESGVSRKVYERAVEPYEMRAAELLASIMKRGQLRETDATVAAKHLCGLLESELLIRFLLHALEDLTPEKIKVVTQRAVEAFLAGHAN